MSTLALRLAALANKLDQNNFTSEADIVDVCLYVEAGVLEKIQQMSESAREEVLKRLKGLKSQPTPLPAKGNGTALNDPRLLKDDLPETVQKSLKDGAHFDISEDIPDDVEGWDIDEKKLEDGGWSSEEEEWFQRTFRRRINPQAA